MRICKDKLLLNKNKKKILFEVDGWMIALNRVKCIGVKEQEQDPWFSSNEDGKGEIAGTEK